ncbi:hypothetical protein OROMI_015208 [Orobanche minor]
MKLRYETFLGIEEKHKKNFIKHAGELHRQFKIRLRSLARDENGNYSKEPPTLYAHLSTVAPYWKKFVENVTKEEFVMDKKIKAGEKNPFVTRLYAWEYARQNTDSVVDDPATLEILEDVVVNTGALMSFRTHCGKTYTKTAFNTFKWTNILCPKKLANDGIFCGHYVGCFIEDVLRLDETSISVNVS